jgi:hypothetical protein
VDLAQVYGVGNKGGEAMTDNITLPRAYAKRLRGLLKIHEDPDFWDEADYAAFAALDAALAEPEPALQVDALRYRWIAENALAIDFVADPDNMVQIWHGTDPARFSAGKTLDEAVDAARRRT